MKKRRRLLIGIAVAFVLLLAGGAFMVVRFANDLAQVQQKDAAIFATNTLSEISQDWSADRLHFYASAEMLIDGKGDERKVKMAELRKRLGIYKSGQGIVTGLRVEKDAGGDDQLVGDYANNAKFEKGEARVEMKLIKRKVGDWQIEGFQVYENP